MKPNAEAQPWMPRVERRWHWRVTCEALAATLRPQVTAAVSKPGVADAKSLDRVSTQWE
jgi:hypothetical protein